MLVSSSHFDSKKKLILQGVAVFVSTVILLVIASFFIESTTRVEASIQLATESTINNSNGTVQKKADVGTDEKRQNVMVWTSTNHPLDGNGDGVFYRRFDDLGVALDVDDVLVNTTVTGNQSEGVVAIDTSGNFVVAWSGVGSDGNPGIFIQAFKNNNGVIAPLGSETRISGATDTYSEPHIAMDYDGLTDGNNLHFVVTWTTTTATDSDVYYRLYTVDFTNAIAPAPVGSENRVNTYTTSDQQHPDVAMNTRGEFMITWQGPGESGTGIWYQMYLQDQTAIGINTLVNSATAGSKSSVAATKVSAALLEMTGERSFVIAYEGSFSSGSGFEEGIGVRRITCNDPDVNNGIFSDITCSNDHVEVIANTSTVGSQTDPDVSADAVGNFTVVWEDTVADGNQKGIVAQSYTMHGKRVGSNFVVNTNTGGDQVDPSVFLNTDGFYTVTFTNSASNTNRFQRYVTEIFKVQSESLPHPMSANNQAKVRTAIAPNGNHVQVWKDYGDQSIRFSLRGFDNNAIPIIENGRVDDPNSTNSDNPVVAFFQDTVGDGAGKFIIAWESNVNGDQDIFYQLYDAAGNPEGSIQQANVDTLGNQVKPALAGGYYYADGTGSGPAITEFALGWIDTNSNVITAGYNNSGFTTTTFGSCTNCGFLNTTLHPSNSRIVYTWNSEADGFQQVFAQQLEGGTLSGSVHQINVEFANQVGSDVAFIDDDQFIVVYSRSPESSNGRVMGMYFNFIPGATPSLAGGPFNVSTLRNTPHPQAYPHISADTVHHQALVVWADFPVDSAKDMIYGQFLTWEEGSISWYGPTFHLNSTQNGQQTLPAVSLNTSGEAVVAWEGNIEQPLLSDSNAVITQLIQNPLTTQSVENFEPRIEQEITAGMQFLEVPNTISFPSVAVNTQDSTTQEVSIRDPDYGGDVKYIEIQDLSGVDFTLTVQASSFVSAEDGKVYITNTEHFKVRNWDQNSTGTDAECLTDTDLCFLTLNSSEDTTAFSLAPETQDFVFVDTQKVLAEKDSTQNNEIGRWRIYPEFQIIIPPVIPAGEHEAQITFTLT